MRHCAVVLIALACAGCARDRFPFPRFDIDGNHVIEGTEFDNAGPVVRELDRNADRRLTWAEFTHAYLPTLAETERAVAASEIFETWDVNQDGRVAFNEFPYSAEIYEQLGIDFDLERFKSSYAAYRVLLRRALVDNRERFNLLDRDQNGSLDSAELGRVGVSQVELRRYDLNGDGVVDVSEVQAITLSPHRWRPLVAVRSVLATFGDLDRNRNRMLDRRELKQSAFLIELIDANGDQELDEPELQSADSHFAAGPIAFEAYAVEVRFSQLDMNGDRQLTAEELGSRSLLEVLDRDGSRTASRKEFSRYRQAGMTLLERLTP